MAYIPDVTPRLTSPMGDIQLLRPFEFKALRYIQKHPGVLYLLFREKIMTNSGNKQHQRTFVRTLTQRLESQGLIKTESMYSKKRTSV